MPVEQSTRKSRRECGRDGVRPLVARTESPGSRELTRVKSKRDWAEVLFVRTMVKALRVVALVADVPPLAIYFEYCGRGVPSTLAPRTGRPSGKTLNLPT